MLLETFPDRSEFKQLLEGATVVPLGVRILADAETPVSVLSRFGNESQNFFLLESAEGGERWGRYSFMGVSARATVTVYRSDVVMRQGIDERRIAHGGQPLKVLRELTAPYKLAEMAGLPRFCGGLVGYFAYEMSSFFESRVPNNLPPEQPMAEFMIPDMLLIFDNVSNTLAVLTLVFKEDGEADELYDRGVERVRELLARLRKPVDTEIRSQRRVVRPPEPVQSKEDFCSMVEEVKRRIAGGEMVQCVVSQRFVGAAPDDLVALYRAQRYVNPSPYLFFIKSQGCTLVGSSPETMIRLDNRTACLRPIAGTRKRGGSEQEDRRLADSLLQDEKERAEHLMLVDLGRSELGRLALAGTVQVTDLMVVERYSHVMHLVSNITADIEPGSDAYDLLPVVLPAGTLSGAPKVRAMESIAELEGVPRGAYGGAVGYFSFDGNMDFCICIRTAVVEHGRLTVQAGAGIVADSDVESEYQETISKAGAMARALELLGGGL